MRQRNPICELTIKRVIAQIKVSRGQIHTCHASTAAVGERHRCRCSERVAVTEVDVCGRGVERDAGNADLCHRLQFAGLADAVAIVVAPYAHLRVAGVAGVEHVVAVAGRAGGAIAHVQRAQRLESGGGVAGDGLKDAAAVEFGDGDEGVDAEEFAA